MHVSCAGDSAQPTFADVRSTDTSNDINGYSDMTLTLTLFFHRNQSKSTKTRQYLSSVPEGEKEGWESEGSNIHLTDVTLTLTLVLLMDFAIIIMIFITIIIMIIDIIVILPPD